MFQSTRPHGARLPAVAPVVEHVGVSIHAPARGATGFDGGQLQVLVVSIHAPARGATRNGIPRFDVGTFQSTRPHGARRIESELRRLDAEFQSTRPHGARPNGLDFFQGNIVFQSTRPHGARRVDPQNAPLPTLFQSTRPHGARPSGWPNQGCMRSFNPRARTGRDGRAGAAEGLCVRFNPRARTGRDAFLGALCDCQVRFNPRARTGRDGIRPGPS